MFLIYLANDFRGGEFLWNCAVLCFVIVLQSIKRRKDKTNYLIFHNFVNIFRIE